MDIGFYIADLLGKQEEVSLPGIGTFATEKVPGSYEPTSNSFIPPSHQVFFKEESSDINSLIEYISIKKNLSLSSAEYFVKKFTSGINEVLQTSGIAEINPLGIFRLENESIKFEKSAKFEVGGKFYGLKPIADLRGIVQPAIQERTSPVLQGNSIEDFIAGHGAEDELEDEEIYEGENKRSRTLLILAGTFVFLIAAGALLYFLNPAIRQFVDRHLYAQSETTPQPGSGKVSKTTPVLKPDSLVNASKENVLDSVKTDSAVAAVQVEKESLPAENITKIEIIGATFGKLSEAEAYVKIMKAKGLQAKIADDMPGKLFKVSLGSFSDEQIAQNELNRIVREVEKTAWIAKYKPKKTK